MVYIYALRCPFSGSTRYIGKSVNPQRRYENHIIKARRSEAKHHCANWIRSLAARGARPELSVLFCIFDGFDWRDIEREFIASYIAEGHSLTNQTRGGDGIDLMYVSDREAAVLALSQSMRKAWADPEKRRRLLASTRDEGTREKRAQAMRELHADPVFRAKQLAGVLAKANSPAVIAKLRATAARPEVRAAKIAANKAKSPETRARQAATLRATWARRKAQAASQ